MKYYILDNTNKITGYKYENYKLPKERCGIGTPFVWKYYLFDEDGYMVNWTDCLHFVLLWKDNYDIDACVYSLDFVPKIKSDKVKIVCEGNEVEISRESAIALKLIKE